MWELLRQYEANDGIKSDPNFFEALAALASNASQKFLRQILPPVESHQLPSVARERNQNLQVKLSCMAIHCLKISNRIQAKFNQPLPIDRMALNWKRLNIIFNILKNARVKRIREYDLGLSNCHPNIFHFEKTTWMNI
jgi:hypothetical protein